MIRPTENKWNSLERMFSLPISAVPQNFLKRTLQTLSQEALWRHWDSTWIPQKHIYGDISYTNVVKTQILILIYRIT
jgi:hypothetical protein